MSFENSPLEELEQSITSLKPVIAPSLKSGCNGEVGPLTFGGAVQMSVGGEFAYIKDSISGGVARSLAQGVGDALPVVPVNLAYHTDEVVQPVKTDVVNDPLFKITPAKNSQIIALTIDAWYPQDEVVITAYKSGVEFYRNDVGSISSGSDYQIDLLVGEGVPLDLFAGTEYEIEIKSQSGTVSLRGEVVTPVTDETPFYAITYYEFDLQPLVTADLPINREVLISQSSAATSQEPSALDTPIQIEFGPAFGSASDPIQVDANGLFTVNESGAYFIKTIAHYGRTTSAGEVELFFRLMINGSQVGDSAFARLDDDNTTIPSSSESIHQLAAGDTFYYELIRDSSNGGINNGGLFLGDAATLGWNDAPTASITISRLVGNAATLQSDGDVVGPGSSNQDELATYANLSGKEIKSSSDVSAVSGTIKRITTDADLNIESNGLGRILVGPNLISKSDGRVSITSDGLLPTDASLEINGPSAFKIPRLSQSQVDATEGGADLAKILYNTSKQQMGYHDGSRYVYMNDYRGYAESDGNNSTSTTLPAVNVYARCNFGASVNAQIEREFIYLASRFQFKGVEFNGVARWTLSISNNDLADLTYDLRASINNESNLVGIWRQIEIPAGETRDLSIDAYMSLVTDDYAQLNIKQLSGSFNSNPTIRRMTFDIS